jgi:outer membrane protein TolC
VAALKFMEIQNKSVAVAEDRLAQLTRQAKEGARARFDVVDQSQEVQHRKEKLIQAQRKVEKEKYKLALFLWEDDNPVVPENISVPDFPIARPKISVDKGKEHAVKVRPELHLVNLEAEFNDIDLEVAENNLLPDLNVEIQPTRKPGEFVLGLGYRFGVQLSFPFYQRSARGDILKKKGKAQRLRLLQRYRLKQVAMDVENAHSAVARAQDRFKVSQEALELAKKLVKGERMRFKLGATSLLIVNLRERSVLKAAEGWITAMADYQKALALYRWSTGQWVDGPWLLGIEG